ncbi:hypothetical protein M378DRAFT_172084 [Amanita muscaria Koide BX008]|uniref:Uncharacterized protein n=1 Tax=Amanita muscaria (strain Koide BX008) TaxID=946122 RepID=A0A0C2S3A8_AMAMK|nr:hypothetical protein M378DRAFT_172084 [Amanita muscaria Koide BX008]
MSFPSWFEFYEPDEGPRPPPAPEVPPRAAGKKIPTVLPIIDSSDEESLVDELNEKFDKIMNAADARANAIIVEFDDAADKGKSVSPEEKGPLSPFMRFSQGPEHFRRAETEKPEGGYFRATTQSPGPSRQTRNTRTRPKKGSDDGQEPPSSPSSPSFSNSGSDSSDSSSPSSNANRRPRRRQRRKSKQRARGFKLEAPSKYDGTADLDIFDNWTYDVDIWAEVNRVSDRMVVRVM